MSLEIVLEHYKLKYLRSCHRHVDRISSFEKKHHITDTERNLGDEIKKDKTISFYLNHIMNQKDIEEIIYRLYRMNDFALKNKAEYMLWSYIEVINGHIDWNMDVYSFGE